MNCGIHLLTEVFLTNVDAAGLKAKVTPWSDKIHGAPCPDRFDNSNIRAGRSGVRIPSGAGDLSCTQNVWTGSGAPHSRVEPFKDEAYLFYIRTQCVPRCKHSPLRL
jgi:hypothetical protein